MRWGSCATVFTDFTVIWRPATSRSTWESIYCKPQKADKDGTENRKVSLLPLIYRWFFFPTVRTILTFSTPVTQAAANSHQITWTKRVCEHYISPVTGVHTSWERVFFGVAAITTYVFFCTGILKKIIDFVYTANFCTSSTFNLPAGEVGTLVIASLLDTEGRMHKPKFQWILKLWIKSKTSPL